MTREEPDAVIYHLAPASELRAGWQGDAYAPSRLPEDGFVHCAGTPEVTLSVAGDYFADLGEPLFVLEIDAARLSAPLRFEAPAPLPGGGRSHLDQADRFPHVYGPIDRAAISGAAQLGRSSAGFSWPQALEPLAAVLARIEPG